jgi:hypothetical protein
MSRGRQRRAGRAKKQRAGVHRSGIGQPAASSIEVAAAEAYERFAQYVQSTSSQKAAAAAARADLQTAVEEVARLTCDDQHQQQDPQGTSCHWGSCCWAFGTCSRCRRFE